MKTPRSFLTPRSDVRRPDAGFTILEMVIVLAIIGMILGVIVTRVGNVFGASQEKVARIFVSDSLTMPLTRYRIDVGSFPSTAEGLSALVTAPSSAADRWRGPYIDAQGGKVFTDPYGEPYQYRYPGTKKPDSFDLFSKGLDKTADTADDIGNW